MRPIRPKKNNWLISKWFLIVISIIFFLLGASLVKEFVRSYKINQEIDSLKTQISELEVSNADFTKFVEYLKTDLYFEEQARIKLGLKAPGEKVIVLQDEPSNASGFQGIEIGQQSFFSNTNHKEKSNPREWLAYFFGTK